MLTRAVVLSTTGLPRPYVESRPLCVRELDLAAPGPGEVLVRVEAASICHSDLSVVNGSRPRPLPMVLGHEGAGVVEEVGIGVSSVQPGDSVVFTFVPACGVCVPCLAGRPALCRPAAQANSDGTLLSGARPFRDGAVEMNQHLGVSAFAEYTVVAVESLVRVPGDLLPEDAALFGCAVVTGLGSVLNTAQARPGHSVAVFGLGGVGLAAVMGAQLAGCYPVVAVDRVPTKLALALRIGASHAVLAGDGALAEIRDLTRGGADITVEAVGHVDVLNSAYSATRPGGTTVAVGLPDPRELFETAAVSIVSEERRLLGSYMGSAVPRRDIPRYIELFRAGRLPVGALRSGVLNLVDINKGFDDLAAATSVREVLLMGGDLSAFDGHTADLGMI